MGATVSMTLDDNTDKNFAFNSMAARGMEILTGSWTLSATTATYDATLKISANITLLIDVPLFVDFGIDTDASGQAVCKAQYQYASDVIELYMISATSTCSYIELASDTAITGVGGYFFAIGINR